MHEHVTCVLAGDESVTLLGVEPLHGACCHRSPPPTCFCTRGSTESPRRRPRYGLASRFVPDRSANRVYASQGSDPSRLTTLLRRVCVYPAQTGSYVLPPRASTS